MEGLFEQYADAAACEAEVVFVFLVDQVWGWEKQMGFSSFVKAPKEHGEGGFDGVEERIARIIADRDDIDIIGFKWGDDHSACLSYILVRAFGAEDDTVCTL